MLLSGEESLWYGFGLDKSEQFSSELKDVRHSSFSEIKTSLSDRLHWFK